MVDKLVKVDEETYEMVQKLAEKTGRSMKDIIAEAVRLIYAGSTSTEKQMKNASSKMITLMYPARCYRCGAQLKQGDLAYYVKVVFEDDSTKSYVYCLDCYLPDRAMAQIFLKKRQLEITVRGLKKMADELADQIKALQLERDIRQIEREIWDAYNRFVTVFGESKDEFTKQAGEILERLADLANKVKVLEDQLGWLKEEERERLVVPIKKKRKEEPAYEHEI